MSSHHDSYLAVWKKQCWKCQNQVTVVMDITEWRGPHATHSGMWKSDVSPDMVKRLVHGAHIQFRKTPDDPDGYFANICAKCDSIQGDWFLNEDLTRFTYETSPKTLSILQLRAGEVVKTFDSIPEMERHRFGRGPNERRVHRTS